MNELDLHSFSNEAITSKEIKFALQNGLWINATATAKEFGKDLENYWRLESTKSYVNKLAELSSVGNTDLKKTIVGKGKPQVVKQAVIDYINAQDEEYEILPYSQSNVPKDIHYG